MLFIVPQGRPLVVNARIDSIHVDLRYLGQDETLRFSTLDQSIMPELTGQVVRISADAFQGVEDTAPFHSAEIRLNEDQRARLAPNTKLLPGTLVATRLKRTASDQKACALTLEMARPATREFAASSRRSIN